MTWTYAGTPSTVPADAVRLRIGDTETRDQQLTDAEISYCLSQASNDVLGAAILGARILMFRFARQTTLSTDGMSDGAGDRYEHYKELVDALLVEQETSGNVIPYVGGQSISEKTSDRTDEDLVQPNFVVGQDDNPNAVPALAPPTGPTT